MIRRLLALLTRPLWKAAARIGGWTVTYHIPNLGGCCWESRPHWCNEDPGHDGDHACCCGHSWPADPELEAATQPSTPTDSPWRRVARAGGR